MGRSDAIFPAIAPLFGVNWAIDPRLAAAEALASASGHLEQSLGQRLQHGVVDGFVTIVGQHRFSLGVVALAIGRNLAAVIAKTGQRSLGIYQVGVLKKTRPQFEISGR